MQYRDDWELDTIPDKQFYGELGRRRGVKSGEPRIRNEPDTEAKRADQRERARRSRSKQKGT